MIQRHSLLAVMAAAACAAPLLIARPALPPVAAAPRGEAPAYVPDEVLIQFKDDATDDERADALQVAGAWGREHLLTHAMRDDRAPGVLRAATRLPVPAALHALQSHRAVAFAEPNWIYRHAAVANDSFYTSGSLWGMYGPTTTPANTFGSQAAAAWAVGHTGSASVYVGVIDEGIQFNHPDLNGQVWTNPFDPVDGIDNDGNGYADDTHGWDFANGDNSVYDGGTTGSLDDHGTHVAGTIGAKGGNGTGVAGVNWKVTMISTKFLGQGGGTTAGAIKALDYLTDLKQRHGLNIVATNNSWGGGGYSQALLDAITRAARAQILFVAAAGNGGSDGVGDNNDSLANYPSNYNTTAGAGYDSVIAVAALTNTGAKASFSNYGPKSVDIGAPGYAIISTTAYNTYSNYSGTSMATPHVTGAAALYASTHLGVSALTIRSAILSRAVPTASLIGKSVTGGRLNVGGL